MIGLCQYATEKLKYLCSVRAKFYESRLVLYLFLIFDQF